ncbi:hypothetical protein EJ08DRAFT_580805 [Tothia fuscella]|uniref:Rab-GAP TBC domain-containing protein n=1 Tax=Tothia fuscella TaxID=1048955 RepID=A0A9P4P0M5_9PEZI|nr:hypothetical protein EJ08DRAFT_580805 [Tothia fuscella]
MSKVIAPPSFNRTSTHPPTSARDITNKQSVVKQQEQHPVAVTTLGLPTKRPRIRKTTPPSTFLPNIITTKRSRSISPASPSTIRTSPRSARSSSNSSHHSNPGFFGASRRQSWQPGRKTVKELEDEIHDSDEELPEDAVIWNVPISPRPPHERDPSRSPKRPDSGEVSPMDYTKGLGINSSGFKSRSRSPKIRPISPLTNPKLPPSISMTAIREETYNPSYPLTPRSATKSWDIAMSELSDEARELTQTLETFAEQREREQEEHVQSRSPKKRPASDTRIVTLSSIELPPMRKGDIMIDPLPISKEKEKVLTRTRPSWLPPKNPEEEKRHLKEYQKMMAKALEAEKRKAKQHQKQQCERDTTKESLARVWEQHVLPNWDTVIQEPRTRELWWRGITPRDRGTVWQKAVGNELELSEASYNAALQRAKAAEKRLSQLSSEERVKEVEWQWFEAIKRDVAEAFPELKIFQSGGPLHEALLDVLMAYSMYRSDVGYVYGTHFITGLLILNLTTPNSFITLANILNRPLPASFLTSDTPSKNRTYDLVLKNLEYKIPNLHAHLTLPATDLHPSEYLDPMFHSLFCSQKFGMDIASRIWDVYIFEGDKALVRAAVGTLAKLEGRLYGNKREILDVLGSSVNGQWDLGPEDEFMQLVRDMGKVDGEEKKG